MEKEEAPIDKINYKLLQLKIDYEGDKKKIEENVYQFEIKENEKIIAFEKELKGELMKIKEESDQSNKKFEEKYKEIEGDISDLFTLFKQEFLDK